MPGRVLAIYEQELDLVTEVFLTPDGHASERTLFDDILGRVRAKDLWIAGKDTLPRGVAQHDHRRGGAGRIIRLNWSAERRSPA